MSTSWLRCDRSLTLALGQPLRHIRGCSPRPGIPMLMYHGIDRVAGTAHPYFEVNTSPRVFARQMGDLREAGYRPVTLHTAITMMRSGMYQEKSVVITFDDGYQNFYNHALPVLQKYRFSATMFVVSGLVGNTPNDGACSRLMTWQEIREIASAGIEIGSHTVSHPVLHSLPAKQVESELKDSRTVIEDHIGTPVLSFSYPYACPEHDTAFLTRLRHLLVDAGYDRGVTTILGRANAESDEYFLPRLPANEHDDPKLLQAKLDGSYDWLHTLQLIHKRTRGFYKASIRPQQGLQWKADGGPEL